MILLGLKAAWVILKGNVVLQIAMAAVIALGALKANNVYQRHVGRDQGRVEVATKINEKAEENVKAAETVRNAAGSGAGGVLNPYQRRP